jgi:hypothetical protein
MSKKRPKVSPATAKVVQAVAKKPKKISGLGVHGDDHPRWRLALVDLDHDRWSFGDADGADLQKILTFLREMEKLTWRQIWDLKTGGGRRRGALHKFIPMDGLCKEAQSSLLKLGLDDASDNWFRFRLGGRLRLWGVLDGQIFYPVWWDSRHEVCPGADR